jgi:hypothetical protein
MPEVSSLLFSEIIIQRLRRKGIFDKMNMDIADIKSVSRMFYNVDSASISSDKYQLNSNSAFRPFVDFISSDANKVDFAMSDLLKENKYTHSSSLHRLCQSAPVTLTMLPSPWGTSFWAVGSSIADTLGSNA